MAMETERAFSAELPFGTSGTAAAAALRYFFLKRTFLLRALVLSVLVSILIPSKLIYPQTRKGKRFLHEGIRIQIQCEGHKVTIRRNHLRGEDGALWTGAKGQEGHMFILKITLVCITFYECDLQILN